MEYQLISKEIKIK